MVACGTRNAMVYQFWQCHQQRIATPDSEVRLWRSTKPKLNLEFERDGHAQWHYATKRAYIHRISFDNTSNSK
jgi:hypothetical protein